MISLGSPGARASLVAQAVNNLLLVRETGVRSLGQEDSPGWTGRPGVLQSMELQGVEHD